MRARIMGLYIFSSTKSTKESSNPKLIIIHDTAANLFLRGGVGGGK